MKNFLEVVDLRPIRFESVDSKPYPVREVTLKERGRWQFNTFHGSVSGTDALLNLHKGDLVAAELSFYVTHAKGKKEQRVLFNNVVKLKEINCHEQD